MTPGRGTGRERGRRGALVDPPVFGVLQQFIEGFEAGDRARIDGGRGPHEFERGPEVACFGCAIVIQGRGPPARERIGAPGDGAEPFGLKLNDHGETIAQVLIEKRGISGQARCAADLLGKARAGEPEMCCSIAAIAVRRGGAALGESVEGFQAGGNSHGGERMRTRGLADLLGMFDQRDGQAAHGEAELRGVAREGVRLGALQRRFKALRITRERFSERKQRLALAGLGRAAAVQVEQLCRGGLGMGKEGRGSGKKRNAGCERGGDRAFTQPWSAPARALGCRPSPAHRPLLPR